MSIFSLSGTPAYENFGTPGLSLTMPLSFCSDVLFSALWRVIGLDLETFWWILFFSVKFYFPAAFFCDPFSFEIILKIPEGLFLTVSCAHVFCLLAGSLSGGRLSWDLVSLGCPFLIRGWGTGALWLHTGSAGERCFRMHAGVSASTLRDPPSYIPPCPGHYFLSASNARNCCCYRLLSSRVVLALYSHLHGFLGSEETKPLSWIRT